MKALNVGILLLVFIAISFHQGCSKSYQYSQHKGDIVKVFMHEPGSYSVMTKDLKIVSFRNMVWRGECELVADVRKGESMWYEATKQHLPHDLHKWLKVTIHIHSPEDVHGGGWKTSGKHPEDVGTVVIE